MQLYQRRYFMLIVMAEITLLNNAVFVSFAPIAEETRSFFNISYFWVNALSWATVISDFALFIPALYVIRKWGCRGVALLSSVLHFLGCASRYFGSYADRDTYYWLLLLGQVLVAIAQPMLNAIAPQLSGDWFGEKERAFATSVVCISSLGGLGAGYALFAFVVGNDFSQAPVATLIELVFSAVLLVSSFFFQAGPPSPPSASAERHGDRDEPVLTEIWSSLQYKQFWVLLGIYSVAFGLFVAVWSTLGEVIEPAHFKEPEQTAGIIGLVMIGSGIVATLVLSCVVDRLRRRTKGGIYKAAVILTTVLTVVGFLLLHLCIRFKAGPVLIYLTSVLAGAASVAIMPACLEAGASVEITHPVSEATSSGLLLAVSNLVGSGFVLALTFGPNILTSFMSICITGFLSVALLPFFRPAYNRFQEEQDKSFIQPLNG